MPCEGLVHAKGCLAEHAGNPLAKDAAVSFFQLGVGGPSAPLTLEYCSLLAVIAPASLARTFDRFILWQR